VVPVPGSERGHGMTTAGDVHIMAGRVRWRAERVEAAVHSHDRMAALAQLAALNDETAELAADLVQLAYNEGATKAAISRWLNVPPSSLRGMVRT